MEAFNDRIIGLIKQYKLRGNVFNKCFVVDAGTLSFLRLFIITALKLDVSHHGTLLISSSQLGCSFGKGF